MSEINFADVTICTAHIPTRSKYLARAVESVYKQNLKPKSHFISVDYNKFGSPCNLDKLIHGVTTKYVAILDDDDELLPNHVEVLYKMLEETNADLCYPWFYFSSVKHAGHLEQWAFKEWNNEKFHNIPITWMAKTEVIKAVGCFSGGFDVHSFITDSQGHRKGQDHNIARKIVDGGYIIKHCPVVTWIYHDQHPRTHGMPSRW